MPLTVGTAGHIDHGKTWLVRALTGKDTDRLPEERARGISIDLGYAPLELPDGRRLSLVDVPGHERFVRTMIAGATGIDLFLLVIDAQEGARPQTHEHLAVLRLLGVEHGVVALTKADAVDEETLDLAAEEARELVPGAEAIAVSAKTGAGLEELRAALARLPVRERDAGDATRLYVDRVFTLRGVGTVATGTLWSGSIAAGDEVRVEPSGRSVRVRSVQVHDAAVEHGDAGQRVAVNLPQLERRDLARGDVLVSPGHFAPSYRLDVRLSEIAPVPAAVTVHIGTNAVPARIVRAGAYAQLRLASAVIAARGDHVVLRTDTTVGGGTVLDPLPPRGLDATRLEALERGDASAFVHQPVARASLRRLFSDAELAALPSHGELVYSKEWLDELRDSIHMRLAARANDIDPGIAVAELLPEHAWALELLGIERQGTKAYLPGATAALGDRAGAANALEARLEEEEIVKVEDRELAAYLKAKGGSAASATATRCRPHSTTAASSSSRHSSRSRSRRFETQPASAAARHSSSSSATTPTGSPFAEETSVYFGESAANLRSTTTSPGRDMRRSLIAAVAVAVVGVVLVAVAAAAKSPGAGSTGIGTVFADNPVQELGNENLTDQSDSDAAVPANAYHDVTLTNLDGSGYLCGDYACVRTSTGNLAYSPTNTFQYTRHADEFEQVMAYYWITEAQKYVHSLGFGEPGGLPPVDNVSQPVRINQYGVDNSFTTDHPTNEIRYGKGGVDDAEDAEVILHEYGHALHQGQGFQFASEQAGAISEGFADYWAVTVADVVSTALGVPEGEPLPCVADWDSTSYTSTVPHCLRRVDTNLHYPTDLNGEVHHDGQIWSRALWDIRQALGHVKADTIILQGSFDFPGTTMPDLATRTVAAAQQLYGDAVADTVHDAFAGRGIL
ncbi:MAG: selenocysteine-specific translation elongation factor [Gaiellaceae bacterium]